MDQTRIDNGTSLEKAQGEEEEELEGEEVVWKLDGVGGSLTLL